MAKLNRDRYGVRREKISRDDFDGADSGAITIASAEDVKFDFNGREKVSLCIKSEELGDKVFWPNGDSLDIIIEQYGDETDEWIGKPLPLMRHRGVSRSGEKFDNLQVPQVELWDEIIEGAGLKPVRKAGGKKVVAKSGRGR